MSNLQNPIFLKIETTAELEAMKNTLSMALDMRGDMFTDDAYLQAKDIRALATKSDDEIKAEMSRRDKIIYANLDEMLALTELFRNLSEAIIKSDER